MALFSFEDFCTELCTLVGVDVPMLDGESVGQRGFALDFGEARVDFAEGAFGDVPGVVVTTIFGAPPPEKEPEVLCALMNANFELAAAGAPAFARNPDTRDIMLQHTLLLSQVDIQSVYNSMVNASEAVAEWRETYFLTTPFRSGGLQAAAPSFA